MIFMLLLIPHLLKAIHFDKQVWLKCCIKFWYNLHPITVQPYSSLLSLNTHYFLFIQIGNLVSQTDVCVCVNGILTCQILSINEIWNDTGRLRMLGGYAGHVNYKYQRVAFKTKTYFCILTNFFEESEKFGCSLWIG